MHGVYVSTNLAWTRVRDQPISSNVGSFKTLGDDNSLPRLPAVRQ
jgi:hypothetical protein